MHKVNADSDLAPVLSLGPLSKRHKTQRVQLLPPWGPQTLKSCPRKTAVWANAGYLLPKEPQDECKLGGSRSQRVTRVEQVEFTRPVQIPIWSCRGMAQHRDSGCFTLK